MANLLVDHLNAPEVLEEWGLKRCKTVLLLEPGMDELI